MMLKLNGLQLMQGSDFQFCKKQTNKQNARTLKRFCPLTEENIHQRLYNQFGIMKLLKCTDILRSVKKNIDIEYAL